MTFVPIGPSPTRPCTSLRVKGTSSVWVEESPRANWVPFHRNS